MAEINRIWERLSNEESKIAKEDLIFILRRKGMKK